MAGKGTLVTNKKREMKGEKMKSSTGRGTLKPTSGSNEKRGLWSRLFGRSSEVTCEEFDESAVEVETIELQQAADIALSQEVPSSSDSELSDAQSSSVAEQGQASAESAVESVELPPLLVEKMARSIWLEEGCPEGRAQEHWYKAEQELRRAKRLS
jgi:hypothetical protein